MPSSIIKFVQARCELLKLNLKSGMETSSDLYLRLSQEATASIAKQVAIIGKLNVENAAEILSIIQGSVTNEKPLFSQEHMATNRDRVDAIVDQSMGPTTTTTPSTKTSISLIFG